MSSKQKIKIPELLAPAGSYDAAVVAINAGADAIYVGGKNFSARSSAHNFTDTQLADIISMAGLRGVKVYVAVNTLYKDTELAQVLDFANTAYSQGAAAFIIQDPGLAYLIKTHMPDAHIHASTQMSVHSTQGVNYMEKMGFSRVVLSRELTLNEVSTINQNTNIACEIFVHGALCVSYSGQCLMSSLIGGRSGNRGKCAQICRTQFELLKNNETVAQGHLLSPRDMNTLDMLDKISATNIAALKIEGRMKNPEYVHIVTSAYRQKLDGIKLEQSTQDNVLQIFNRGGSFSTGYYYGKSGKNMMSTKTPKSSGAPAGTVLGYKNNHCKIKFDIPFMPGDGIEIWTKKHPHVGTGISKPVQAGQVVTLSIEGKITVGDKVFRSHSKGLVDQTKQQIAKAKKQMTVAGHVNMMAGEQGTLTLRAGEATVTTTTPDIIPTATQHPTTTTEVLTQLSKTGNTPFVIDWQSINVGANMFVGKSMLNAMRREAVALLEKAFVAQLQRPPYTINLPQVDHQPTLPMGKSIQLPSIEHLAKIDPKQYARIYVNLPDKIEAVAPYDNVFIALPHICHNQQEEKLTKLLPQLEASNISGYLVSTFGQLNILENLNTRKKIVLDYTFNILNATAGNYFLQKGHDITLSQELTHTEIEALNLPAFEIITEGRQTVMAIKNCPIGAYCHCGAPGHYALKDRMGEIFPIHTDCAACVAYLKNSKVLNAKIKSSKATLTREILAADANKDTDHQSAQTAGHFTMGIS